MAKQKKTSSSQVLPLFIEKLCNILEVQMRLSRTKSALITSNGRAATTHSISKISIDSQTWCSPSTSNTTISLPSFANSTCTVLAKFGTKMEKTFTKTRTSRGTIKISSKTSKGRSMLQKNKINSWFTLRPTTWTKNSMNLSRSKET